MPITEPWEGITKIYEKPILLNQTKEKGKKGMVSNSITKSCLFTKQMDLTSSNAFFFIRPPITPKAQEY